MHLYVTPQLCYTFIGGWYKYQVYTNFLGQNNIGTTMRYTHVNNFKIESIKSPLDKLKNLTYAFYVSEIAII